MDVTPGVVFEEHHDEPLPLIFSFDFFSEYRTCHLMPPSSGAVNLGEVHPSHQCFDELAAALPSVDALEPEELAVQAISPPFPRSISPVFLTVLTCMSLPP